MKHTKLTRFSIAFILTTLMILPIASINITLHRPVPEFHFSGAITITHPQDIEFENGTTGKQIVWNVTTDIPKNYTVSRNDTVIASSASWDGGLIEVPVDWIYRDGLVTVVPTLFVFECTVFDTENDTISDIVQVTVQPDITAPGIEGPGDFDYEVGSIGHYIRWNVSETNPDFFNITRRSNETSNNESIIDSGDWGGQNFTLNVDYLNESHWYDYSLWVNDTLGHVSTDIVRITIYPDLSPPEVDSPDDIIFEFGDDPQYLTWHTYDSNPKNYSIEIIVRDIDTSYGNASEFHGPPDNSTQPWTIIAPDGVDIQFVLHELFVGNYTYTITLTDINNRNVSDSVDVTIYYDTRGPVISSPGNLEYEEGYTGNIFEWSAEESNPKSFNLTLDDELIREGIWLGENITIGVDGYEPGSYEFELNLVDYFNQMSTDLVTLSVTPDSQLPHVDAITVVEAFASTTENAISIQAYASDRNGIHSVRVEWYTKTNDTINDKDMELVSSSLYAATLGDYLHGSVVIYRVIATDNSSVRNSITSDWTEFTVEGMYPEQTPGIIWGILLLLGGLSLLIIFSLYFRTRTR